MRRNVAPKDKKVSKKGLTKQTTFGIIYIVVSDGNELLSLRHANLENDTYRMIKDRHKSIPKLRTKSRAKRKLEHKNQI
jgi:hypothetical protein